MQKKQNLKWLWLYSLLVTVVFGNSSILAQGSINNQKAEDNFRLGVSYFQSFQSGKIPSQTYLDDLDKIYLNTSRAHFEKSYRIIPGHPATLYFLMLIYSNLEKLEPAQKFAKKVLNVSSGLDNNYKNGALKIKEWAEQEINRLSGSDELNDTELFAPPSIPIPDQESWYWKKL